MQPGVKPSRAMNVLLVAASFVVAGISLPTSLAVPLPSHDVELFLTTASRAIQTLDPLAIKVTLFNESKQPISTSPPLDRAVQLEFRRVGDKDCVIFCRKTFDCSLGISSVAPSSRLACYKTLFFNSGRWFLEWKSPGDAPGPVFARAGEYEIRARLTVVRGEHHIISGAGPAAKRGSETIVSPPVIVKVTSRSVPEEKLITKHLPLLEQFIQDGVRGSSVQALAAVERELTDSALKTTLLRILACEPIAKAKSPDALASAIASGDQLYDRLDGVARDLMDLAVAKAYYGTKDWAKAEERLLRMKEPSCDRDWLLREVRNRREWEKGVKELLPCDRRLDTGVSYRVDNATFAEVLALLSKEAGVPLDGVPPGQGYEVNNEGIFSPVINLTGKDEQNRFTPNQLNIIRGVEYPR